MISNLLGVRIMHKEKTIFSSTDNGFSVDIVHMFKAIRIVSLWPLAVFLIYYSNALDT